MRGGDAGEGEIYNSKTKTLKSFERYVLNVELGIRELSQDLPTAGSEVVEKGLSPLLTLSFLTPTRLVYDGHLTLDLEFHVLIRQILRRLSLLGYFHCGVDPLGIDFKRMIEAAKLVKVKDCNLKWYDWERYSARQDTRMKMGGFVGEISFEGNVEPFMPLIKAGEILHVGKGTGLGLGKFKIQDSRFKI